MSDVGDLLRTTPVFRSLSPVDRETVARAASIRQYRERPDDLRAGRALRRVLHYRLRPGEDLKMLPSGKDLILEIFGRGDPLGAVAAYDGRPFPASAVALEETTCVMIARAEFFRLLEQHPSLVRGLLQGLTHRLVEELTNRLAELSGGTIERRFARLFLKLSSEMGRQERGGTFVPLSLSRQELADMTGTTIETCIRIMSRWGKQEVVRTEKDGFVVLDRKA